MTVLDTIVVGSGPAGVATARALLRRGRAVHLLDVGFTQGSARFPSDDGSSDAMGGLGRKLALGSDHPYRPPRHRALLANDTALVPSHARGGLSTVWGATMLPYHADDMARWPIGPDELGAGYREVADYVPVAAAGDDALDGPYPLDGSERPALRPGAMTATVLDRLSSRAARLARHGVVSGRARLAVHTGRPGPAAGCSYCGECRTGCPYGHIYSAEQTLAGLCRWGSFRYQPGVFVERVDESGDEATVWFEDLGSGSLRRLRARRVLLAAGAVGTTALLQRSGHIPDSRTLLDSALAVVPVAVLGARPPRHEARHTLAQLFFRVEGRGRCARAACIQLYEHDPAEVDRARAVQPLAARLPRPVVATMLASTMTAFVYLHSDLSGTIRCETGLAGTRLRAVEPEPADAEVRRVVARWRRALAPAGLVPLDPLRVQLPAGQGFHVGGSVPMRDRPTYGEADLLGRPRGLRRIHAVDASVFPTIPAGPITFSVMANATRIAAAVAAGDGARGDATAGLGAEEGPCQR